MASFYGAGAIKITINGDGTIGGGGSAPTTPAIKDYSELENVPIKIIEGTAEKPIIISELDNGMYLVSGVFKWTPTANASFFIQEELLTVSQDNKTLTNKNAYYHYINDDQLYMRVTILYPDGSFDRRTIKISDNGTQEKKLDAMIAIFGNSYAEAVNYYLENGEVPADAWPDIKELERRVDVLEKKMEWTLFE